MKQVRLLLRTQTACVGGNLVAFSKNQDAESQPENAIEKSGAQAMITQHSPKTEEGK